jgi:hypothetical protein
VDDAPVDVLPSTIVLRVAGDGPTFVKIGRRVVYRTTDLDKFLDQRAVIQRCARHNDSRRLRASLEEVRG